MARPSFAILFLFSCLAAMPVSRADDVDDAEARLATAREAHSKAMAKVREEVAKLIGDRETTEANRANPDLKKIEAIQIEREESEKGKFPRWLAAKQNKQIADANKKLITSLTEAKAALTRAKEYDKAKVFDKEIQELSSPQGMIVDRSISAQQIFELRT